MSIDLKFVVLTADVLEICSYKIEGEKKEIGSQPTYVPGPYWYPRAFQDSHTWYETAGVPQ